MRYDKGWIKLWRLDDEHWLSKDNTALFLWWRMLSIATYKPSKIRSGKTFIDLPPGTIVTSSVELSSLCGFGRTTVRRLLDAFETDNMIDQRPTSEGTIITIRNWSKYQENENATDQRSDTQPTSDQPTTDQRPTNDRPLNEELKKLRKKERKNIYCPKSDDSEPQTSKRAVKGIELDHKEIVLAKRWFNWAKTVSQTVKEDEDAWAYEMNKLVRLDGLEHDYLWHLLEFIKQDPFWSLNAISPMSLRSRSKNGLMKWENIKASYDKALKAEEEEAEEEKRKSVHSLDDFRLNNVRR